MKITLDHPCSSYGIPVILDDRGAVMDYAPGIKEIRRRLNLPMSELAVKCGVSPRTFEGYEQGKPPSAAVLNVLGIMLSKLDPEPF